MDESSIARRDISLMQQGSRFRPSPSSVENPILQRSVCDEKSNASYRMMFDSHSLQVNYVNAADQQPESNLVREELVEELKNRILDVQQR
ncbi:hypothetical protein RB195_018665 [Necator americanus]